jgi:asparaginyl-tRNA synthetase
MKVVDISDLRSHTGEEVTVRGWLRRKRSSGKIQFLFLRDGSGFVQAIVERSSVSDSVFQNANNLKMESSVVVNGVVKVEERAPGGVELLVTDIEVVQIPEKDFRSTNGPLDRFSYGQQASVAQNSETDTHTENQTRDNKGRQGVLQ